MSVVNPNLEFGLTTETINGKFGVRHVTSDCTKAV